MTQVTKQEPLEAVHYTILNHPKDTGTFAIKPTVDDPSHPRWNELREVDKHILPAVGKWSAASVERGSWVVVRSPDAESETWYARVKEIKQLPRGLVLIMIAWVYDEEIWADHHQPWKLSNHYQIVEAHCLADVCDTAEMDEQIDSESIFLRHQKYRKYKSKGRLEDSSLYDLKSEKWNYWAYGEKWVG